MNVPKPLPWLAAGLIGLCAILGGGNSPIDRAAYQWSGELGRSAPVSVDAAAWLSDSASWPVLIAVAVLAGLALAVQRRLRAAMLVIAVSLGGRFTVDTLKWLSDRPRPAEESRLAVVQSMSFPSGHAANSMILWLTLALLLATGRARTPLVLAAIGYSVAVGLSRLVLQVHWLTDVVAGWLFGVLWVGGWLRLAGRGTGLDRDKPDKGDEPNLPNRTPA